MDKTAILFAASAGILLLSLRLLQESLQTQAWKGFQEATEGRGICAVHKLFTKRLSNTS